MKKTLAVVLSVIMLLCCIPFAANAAETIIFKASANFESSNQLVSGNTYIIGDASADSGITMNVPNDLTLYVPANTTLRVSENSKLNVYGSIIVLNGGTLVVEGFLNGAANIKCDEGGVAKTQIRFPSLESCGLTNRIEVSYAYSTQGNIYEDLEGSLVYMGVSDSGEEVEVPLNQYIYINAHIIEPDLTYDKFDDSLMTVYFNGVGLPYSQGSSHTRVTTSGDISYAKMDDSNLSDFLNTFNIYLPTGEGYTVYGREGEQSADGETVKLKYGQSFSFKVEIDPEYDMSAYEVYVYNGYGWTDLDTSTLLKDIAPAVPDEYGYYHIDEIKGEHTIYVVGVVKNETLLMVGDILDMVRNVFEMITAFFQEILAFFGLSVGGTDAV